MQCRLVKRSAGWNVEGFALDSNGDIGTSMGEAQWRPTFSVDWERGHVFGGREDMLLLDGTMTIVVSRPGWVWFEIGGDDGFALFINGESILEDWQNGLARKLGRYLWMQPGIYELGLRYYEWTDRAELRFNASQDILKWSEAVGCDESDKTRLSALASGAIAFDGALLFDIDPSPKVVLLQGIDSEGSCEDVRAGWESLGRQLWRNGRPYQSSTSPFLTPEPTPSTNGMFMRRQTLVSALQDHLLGDWEGGVLSFSYSGSYENCVLGRNFAAEDYPFGDYRVFPKYHPENTCVGVRDAAATLGTLLASLHAQEPDRELVLMGHSLGGMVAAYYVAELAPPEILDRIRSIVTLDSPLLGYSESNPFSACHPSAQSWEDVLGVSDVVKIISSIEGTNLAKKFVHLNSTDIGDSLWGGREVGLECGTESAVESGLVGALLGTLLTGGWSGLIAGALGGEAYGTYGPGHSCGFYDPAALREIIEVLQQ